MFIHDLLDWYMWPIVCYIILIYNSMLGGARQKLSQLKLNKTHEQQTVLFNRQNYSNETKQMSIYYWFLTHKWIMILVGLSLIVNIALLLVFKSSKAIIKTVFSQYFIAKLIVLFWLDIKQLVSFPLFCCFLGLEAVLLLEWPVFSCVCGAVVVLMKSKSKLSSPSDRLVALIIFIVCVRLDRKFAPSWIAIYTLFPIFLLKSYRFFSRVMKTILVSKRYKSIKFQQRRKTFALFNLSIALFSESLIYLVFLNWLFGFPKKMLIKISLYCNMILLAYLWLFWKQILYCFISFPFRVYERASQNKFVLLKLRNYNLNNEWSVERCSYCSQNEANVVFLGCGHLCLCEKCHNSHYWCIMCDKVSIVGKICYAKPEENKIFKISFYSQSQFKVFVL